MADLPWNRTIAEEPPFTHAGMDYFGPLVVKRGRSTVKRYGVLIICLGMRAVHLEVAASMDTRSCIDAIRRFVARRGIPKIMMSDNGINSAGAKGELQQALKEWNQSHIKQTMLQKGIKWHFSLPSGSHFGGSWE